VKSGESLPHSNSLIEIDYDNSYRNIGTLPIVGDTEAAETALTELITASYSDGYSFAKNEAGLIEEVSNALAAD